MNKVSTNFSPDQFIMYLRKSRQDDPNETIEEVLSKHETILQEYMEREYGFRVPPENTYREVCSGESIESREEIKKAPQKTEEAKTAEPKAEAPRTVISQSGGASGELKVLRGWGEICDRAAADNGAALGFLRMAKAFTDGSKIYIRFPNDFARSMVDNPSMRESLRASICLGIKRSISAADLVFGIFEGNEDTISDLDEFNLD